jgi:hypothetical protein
MYSLQSLLRLLFAWIITINIEWHIVTIEASFWIQVIKKYGSSGKWITGVAVDVLGALLMLKAVSQAPVSECFVSTISPAFCKHLSLIAGAVHVSLYTDAKYYGHAMKRDSALQFDKVDI